MGCLFSCCFKNKNTPGDHYRSFSSEIFPTYSKLNFEDEVPTPNDNKFLFIPFEKRIDNLILELEDKNKLSSTQQTRLETTLAELKSLQEKYNPFLRQEITEEQANLEESQFFMKEFASDGLGSVNGTKRSGDSKGSTQNSSNSSRKVTYMQYSANAAALRKDIKNGMLSFEVLKGNFCHPALLDKLKLSEPYIVITIYSDQTKKKSSAELITKNKALEKMSTNMNANPQNPIWDAYFEYEFQGEEPIKYCYIEFSLYYKKEGSTEPYLVGEQMFSLSSFLDQKLQVKDMDFKMKGQKGTAFSLRARIQLISNGIDLKERLYREIKCKYDRLYKIGGKTTRKSDSSKSITTSFRMDDMSNPSRAGSLYENSQDNSYFIK